MKILKIWKSKKFELINHYTAGYYDRIGIKKFLNLFHILKN